MTGRSPSTTTSRLTFAAGGNRELHASGDEDVDHRLGTRTRRSPSPAPRRGAAARLKLWNGTFTNSGTFTISAAGHLSVNSSDTLFKNTGTLTSNLASGAVQIDSPFANAGTITSTAGTLLFAGYADTFAQTAGSLAANGGTIAAYVPTQGQPNDPRTIDIQGGRLRGRARSTRSSRTKGPSPRAARRRPASCPSRRRTRRAAPGRSRSSSAERPTDCSTCSPRRATSRSTGRCRRRSSPDTRRRSARRSRC